MKKIIYILYWLILLILTGLDGFNIFETKKYITYILIIICLFQWATTNQYFGMQFKGRFDPMKRNEAIIISSDKKFLSWKDFFLICIPLGLSILVLTIEF